jgi:ADP-ribose pyrophosphatase YjhB (NUDIX family)
VAAICYRVRQSAIEFLLVRTRGGRWTFPKGGVEPGLTHAQAAALEAFEEAGVHGRIEEAPFARYVRGKRPSESKHAVYAYLCEVLRLVPPQESNRDRTWFSHEKAKRNLCKGRTQWDGDEMARVVDRAVTRIQRLHAENIKPLDSSPRDTLQKVSMEAVIPAKAGSFAALALNTYFSKMVRQPVHGAVVRVPRLGNGADIKMDVSQKVTAIDHAKLPASRAKGTQKHRDLQESFYILAPR